jgi:hypothetical protein
MEQTSAEEEYVFRRGRCISHGYILDLHVEATTGQILSKIYKPSEHRDGYTGRLGMLSVRKSEDISSISLAKYM